MTFFLQILAVSFVTVFVGVVVRVAFVSREDPDHTPSPTSTRDPAATRTRSLASWSKYADSFYDRPSRLV